MPDTITGLHMADLRVFAEILETAARANRTGNDPWKLVDASLEAVRRAITEKTPLTEQIVFHYPYGHASA